MDGSVLRQLAFRALRLAELNEDPGEAARLRLAAADYFEKAERLSADEQQQQPEMKAADKQPEA